MRSAPRLCKTLLSQLFSWLTVALLLACGGGGDAETPTLSILQPTAEAVYETVWTDVRLGGTLSGAAFVHVTNTATGYSTEGYVFYNLAAGSWFADLPGLTIGDNPIVVVADADGSGVNTASDTLTVRRPLEPLSLIFNGPNALSAGSHWVDMNALYESHKLALYEDGTGRSTTGDLFSEDAGTAVDITWTQVGPDELLISGCPSCSFQRLSRISGSMDEALFLGQVETVGGVGETALHAFVLSVGGLP